MENQQQIPEFRAPEPEHNDYNFLQSTTARVIMVGLLTLLLLIPLQYVKNLITERAELQEEVSAEVTQSWGGEVYFYGPILKVPYKIVKDTQVVNSVTKLVTVQRSVYTDYAYFFPEELKATANVETQSKHRSKYESAVFNAKMNFKGHYPTPDFSSQNIAPENIEWEKASILINTNNIKSIKGGVNINVNGSNYAFEPAAKESENDSMATLQTTPINLRESYGSNMPFDLNISYDGSKELAIVPIGKLTEAKIRSNWASPKFAGNFIPDTSTIADNGFVADWKISHLNRPFVQQHFTVLPDLQKYSFKTGFLIMVNEYQQNERASKYGFLVIGLTFLIFFLIQTISKINIHIFQYGMIGIALVMFYTLLISITEHSSFMLAYIIAGIAVVVMIGLYSVSILKNKKFPLLIASSLTVLYTFIYIIIQLENYALLAGSVGLFFILGAVMYISRKIDWTKSAGA